MLSELLAPVLTIPIYCWSKWSEASALSRFRQRILTVCRFLGIVDKLGSAYEEEFTSTSFGLYFCLPLMRSLYRENMTEEEARAVLEECARVGYYRNCLATNRVGRGEDASGVDSARQGDARGMRDQRLLHTRHEVACLTAVIHGVCLLQEAPFRSASFRYIVFIRTSVVRSPGVVMTAEFPRVVEFDDFLRCLGFDRLTNLVEVLTVHGYRRLEYDHLVRIPLLQRA